MNSTRLKCNHDIVSDINTRVKYNVYHTYMSSSQSAHNDDSRVY